MRRVLSIVVILLLMGVALAFTALNLGSIELQFYFFTLTLPIAVATFLFILIGAVLGVLASSTVWMRKANELRRLRRKLADMENELANLRRLPIKDSP